VDVGDRRFIRNFGLIVAASMLLAGLSIGWNAAQALWPPVVVVEHSPAAAASSDAGAPEFACPRWMVGIDGICTAYAPLEP